ncbi:MAG: hypothetical protein ACPG49_12360, partial [Chitinophagales bacterium]
MKQLTLIAAIFFLCNSILIGQNKVQIALVSDDATGQIIGSSIEVVLVSLKSLGRDDCDSEMQFKGTADIDLGEENGRLIYSFDAEPTNDLQFGKNAYLTTMGYAYGEKIDVWFKILDRDKPSCGSKQDIVDVNSQTTENALKIRIAGHQVWLLNSQGMEMKVLGNVGEVIAIRGNRYVNNSANTKRLRGRKFDNREQTNQQRGGKWNLSPNSENLSAPDIEVAEFQFIVKKELGYSK